MAERVPLTDLYAGAQARTRELVLAGLAADQDVGLRPVPATPGWTVHDVVAHVTGVAQDVRDGVVPQRATPEWTATHVERGAGVPVPDLLDRWDATLDAVLAVLEKAPVWPLVMDAGSHEHDLRAALGDSGAREEPLVRVAAKVLLSGLDAPVPLVVSTEHHTVAVGGADRDDAAVTRLRTTDFEAFRWRLGRRSPAQIAAMDWSGDPAPFLVDLRRLCIFGPASADVLE